MELIYWIRFILFDGDQSDLVAEKMVAQQKGEVYNPSNFGFPMGL